MIDCYDPIGTHNEPGVAMKTPDDNAETVTEDDRSPTTHSGCDHTTDQMLRRFLRLHDSPCPICRYNLRSLTSDVCPECGQRFELRIGSSDPRIGAFLGFLAPMIMMSGIALLFLVLTIVVDSRAPWGAYAVMCAGIIDGILVLVLCRRRAWFHRRTKQAQTQLAALAWIANAAFLIASVRFGWD